MSGNGAAMVIDAAAFAGVTLPPAGPLPARRAFVLRLEAHGAVGVGIAVPAPGREAAARSQLADLCRSLPGRRLTVADPRPPELGPDLPIEPDRARVRAALDTALLDLAGRIAGLPVHRVLGGRPPKGGLAYNALLPAGSTRELLAAAERALARGVATLKLKIARRPESLDGELEALARLRSAIGPSASLRVDANGRLDPPAAAGAAARLAEIGVEYFEQPVAPRLLWDLPAFPVPVAADESLEESEGAARLRNPGPVRVAVLKPAHLGGPRACLALARVARAAGIGVVVTHAFDGPIGFAAAAETALALPGPTPACGLDPEALGERFDPPQIRGPRVVPHDRPGLGLGEEIRCRMG
ncbi:MAG: O-succinylbenzoate synthase [Acidobacteria bacterium]|nr:MAG: O-succinylbenzoate synthase [Acidobacteriota bacterium]